MTVIEARELTAQNLSHFTKQEVDRILSRVGINHRERLWAALALMGFRSVEKHSLLRVRRSGGFDSSVVVTVIDRHPSTDMAGEFILVVTSGLELCWLLEEWEKAVADIRDEDETTPDGVVL